MQAEQVAAGRAVDELEELAELPGGPDGPRRVAWTEDWEKAREWFRGKLEEIEGITEIETDEAGNVWATAPGDSERAVILGGHIGSVPYGGWLDGALNVVGALEVMRVLAPQQRPVTLRLVDWADEEGARFGRSLFGSGAAARALRPDDVRSLKDSDGVALPDALQEHGIDLDRVNEAGRQLENAVAYLELHIEQGPVLERMDLPLGVVLGTFGVERHAVRFTGQHAHSGSTPMDVRRDAGPARSRRRRARRHAGDGEGGEPESSGGGERRGRVGAALADRADTFRRGAYWASRGGRKRGGREVAPVAERSPARCGGDGAAHAYGYALRKELQGPESHQGGRHTGGGSGTFGAGAAPTRGANDGLGGQPVVESDERKGGTVAQEEARGVQGHGSYRGRATPHDKSSGQRLC